MRDESKLCGDAGPTDAAVIQIELPIRILFDQRQILRSWRAQWSRSHSGGVMLDKDLSLEDDSTENMKLDIDLVPSWKNGIGCL